MERSDWSQVRLTSLVPKSGALTVVGLFAAALPLLSFFSPPSSHEIDPSWPTTTQTLIMHRRQFMAPSTSLTTSRVLLTSLRSTEKKRHPRLHRLPIMSPRSSSASLPRPTMIQASHPQLPWWCFTVRRRSVPNISSTILFACPTFHSGLTERRCR